MKPRSALGKAKTRGEGLISTVDLDLVRGKSFVTSDDVQIAGKQQHKGINSSSENLR